MGQSASDKGYEQLSVTDISEGVPVLMMPQLYCPECLARLDVGTAITSTQTLRIVHPEVKSCGAVKEFCVDQTLFRRKLPVKGE